MLLSVSHIKKSFNEVPILGDCSFTINDYERVAVVGLNGAGKTTLLRIITGEMPSDDGTCSLSRGATMGYLAQNAEGDSEETIYDEVLSVLKPLLDIGDRLRTMEANMGRLSGQELETLMEQYHTLSHQFDTMGGHTYKSEIAGVLKGLGFSEEEFDKKVSLLSGGQKTRVALGKLLLQKPDLIILDEPTNHLDMGSIRWLETYLSNYKGAVLVVSHDRYFLDKISQKIVEIDRSRCTVFTGNYSDYTVKREQMRIAEENAYAKQQANIAHQEAVIEKLKSFNREKSIKRAESREKMLDKIERLDKPLGNMADMKLTLTPRIISGNDVLAVEHLEKSFGSMNLFSDLNFSLRRGDHVAIIGANGTGKTTILKILNEVEQADSGVYKLGTNVQIGYYDQEHHVLHAEKSIFDEISDEFPYLTGTEIRNMLAAFLFTGDDVFKQIKLLSGGERGRVSLAKLMLSEANLLILDEPTNHLDMASKEILENALNSYEGTLLYVSHDRYFINKTADRILELENQKLTEYLGNYDEYLAKKEALGLNIVSGFTGYGSDRIQAQTSAGAESSQSSAGSMDWKAQKEEQARLRKLENRLKKVEEEIAALEADNADIEATMAEPDVCANSVKLNELSSRMQENNSKLEAYYEEWETLSEEL